MLLIWYLIGCSSLCVIGFLEFVSGEIYHIAPLSSTTSCPDEPCLTLSQLAANSRNYIKSNTTLIFLTGSHILDIELIVSDSSEISMFPQSDLLSSNPNILCMQTARFIFNNMNLVQIRGLKFNGCAGNIVRSVHQFTFSGSIFQGQENTNGTALKLVETTASIDNTSFSLNMKGSNQGPIGILIYRRSENPELSVYAWCGGAIIATQSNVTIVESVFKGNRAELGGAIFGERGSKITIFSSTFVSNEASRSRRTTQLCYGGAVYLEDDQHGGEGEEVLTSSMKSELLIVNCKFINNSACSAGGATGLYHSNMIISDCTFFGNIAELGGGMMALEASIATQQSEFQHNIATFGGVVGVIVNADISIIGSLFRYNRAESGGVLVADTLTSVTVLVSNFSYNTAWTNGQGGVAGIVNSCTMIIKGCHFYNNTAGNGGILRAEQKSSVVIVNSEIHSNEARFGGVAYTTDGSHLTIVRSHFDSNRARLGGVVLAQRQLNVRIIDSNFSNNTAQKAGGVVIVSEDCSVAINGSQFRSNSAEMQGGVVEVEKQSIVILLDSVFLYNTGGYGVAIASSNSLMIMERNHFWNNQGKSASCLGTAQFSVMSIHHSTFNNNTAQSIGGVIATQMYDNAIINESLFMNNKAQLGGVMSIHEYSNITIHNSDFTNNSAQENGGVIITSEGCTATINGSRFSNNWAKHGGVIYALIQSVVISLDCNFLDTTADYEGGAAVTTNDSSILFDSCNFSGNKARSASVAVTVSQSSIIIYRSTFDSNAVIRGDGAVLVIMEYSISVINQCQFSNNIAQRGGVMSIRYHSNITIRDSEFNGNFAQDNGGVFYVSNSSTVFLLTSQIKNNSSPFGGVMHVEGGSRISINNCILSYNEAQYMGGTLFVLASWLNISNSLFLQNLAGLGIVYTLGGPSVSIEKTEFSDNYGSFYAYNTVISFYDMLFKHCSSSQHIYNEGGAITAILSNIVMEGRCVFMYNSALNGAAISLTESHMYVDGHSEITIANNTALISGGGLHLYQSEVKCEDQCKLQILDNSAIKGGGIHAISSSIKVHLDRLPGSVMHFINNKAKMGGGVYLETDAKIYVLKDNSHINRSHILRYGVYFMANSADYGGAVYIADDTSVGACDNISLLGSASNHANSECFLQVFDLGMAPISSPNLVSVKFTLNTANKSGSALYGGLLDRCTVSPFSGVYSKTTGTLQYNVSNGVMYLVNVSNLQLNFISSDPVKLCFCRNDHPDCTYQPPPIQVKKGEKFVVTLVAVDQVNHTVSNTAIHSYLQYTESGLGEGQLVQRTSKYCTDMIYSVFSLHTSEKLIVYAEGPCKDASISQSWINIKFLPCLCAIGFQQKITEKTNCLCECDSKLYPLYISDCNFRDDSNSWIGYINETMNSSGYLIYPHCPLDYCLPTDSGHRII